jgi:hypothetical protein
MGHENAIAAGREGLAAPRFVRVDLLEKAGHGSLDATSALSFLDQCPELLRFREGVVIADRQIGTVEKILEGVFAQDAVYDDGLVVF